MTFGRRGPTVSLPAALGAICSAKLAVCGFHAGTRPVTTTLRPPTSWTAAYAAIASPSWSGQTLCIGTQRQHVHRRDTARFCNGNFPSVFREKNEAQNRMQTKKWLENRTKIVFFRLVAFPT